MRAIERIFARRKSNQLFLRRVAAEVGKEIGGWTYEKLSRPAEEISFTRVIDNIPISFSVESYEKNKDGDLHVCLDVDAKLPTLSITLPSYVFWKKADGGVYY
jgi:hypothetical protein